MLPDEFPLNVFYEALRKKLGDVIASTSGITGMSTATPVPAPWSAGSSSWPAPPAPAGHAVVQRLVASGATVVAADPRRAVARAVVDAGQRPAWRRLGTGAARRGGRPAGRRRDHRAGPRRWLARARSRRRAGAPRRRAGAGASGSSRATWPTGTCCTTCWSAPCSTRHARFHDALRGSDDARLAIVSTVQAQAPSATNAAYAAAKAAAETWTLAVADSFTGSGCCRRGPAHQGAADPGDARGEAGGEVRRLHGRGRPRPDRSTTSGRPLPPS